MEMAEKDDTKLQPTELLELTTEIVSAFVGNISVPTEEIPSVIQSVHKALSTLGNDAPGTKQKPAVPIKKSVTRDYLICLEDGMKWKTLKRHLANAHGMTPQEYRAKWGLRGDYPMLAPAYSEARSKLAKKLGLGNVRRKGKKAKKG